MKISIIIPNYNGENLLKENLPKVIEAAVSYAEEESSTVEVIVIDDKSTDNSVAYIKNQILNSKNTYQISKIEIKALLNAQNIGFSSSVSKGVKEARGDIVMLLNTDVAPAKDFLIPLLMHFVNEEVFAVGCLDKSIENGKVVLRGRGIGRWQRGFLVHSRGEVDKPNTLWVSGGSGAFRKSTWDKLRGFNELYNPFYWEDIDLSYRALKSGYKILFEPKSVVVHEHEKGSIKKIYSRFQIKTIAYRNQFIFVWHNATDLDLQFLHIFWLPYHFFKALTKRDWPFFLGFFQAFIKLPKIMQSSFKAQRYFVKKDREVIREFMQ